MSFSNILIFEQLYAYDITDLICIKKFKKTIIPLLVLITLAFFAEMGKNK